MLFLLRFCIKFEPKCSWLFTMEIPVMVLTNKLQSKSRNSNFYPAIFVYWLVSFSIHNNSSTFPFLILQMLLHSSLFLYMLLLSIQLWSSFHSVALHSVLLPLRGCLYCSHILGFFLMVIFSQQEMSHKSSFCSHWGRKRERVRERESDIKPHTHLLYLMPLSPKLGCAWICFVYIPMHLSK